MFVLRVMIKKNLKILIKSKDTKQLLQQFTIKIIRIERDTFIIDKSLNKERLFDRMIRSNVKPTCLSWVNKRHRILDEPLWARVGFLR